MTDPERTLRAMMKGASPDIVTPRATAWQKARASLQLPLPPPADSPARLSYDRSQRVARFAKAAHDFRPKSKVAKSDRRLHRSVNAEWKAWERAEKNVARVVAQLGARSGPLTPAEQNRLTRVKTEASDAFLRMMDAQHTLPTPSELAARPDEATRKWMERASQRK